MYGNFCKNKEIIDLGKTTYETSTIETTDTDEFLQWEGPMKPEVKKIQIQMNLYLDQLVLQNQ